MSIVRSGRIKGYSPAKRKHALETMSELPQAVRVPPHRQLWPFILSCLNDVHESTVVEFIEDNRDLALKAEKDALVAAMSQMTPDPNHRKHCRQIIHQTMQLPKSRYGVASVLPRISRASKTPEGREDLQARCVVSPAALHCPPHTPSLCCCTASISTWIDLAGSGPGTPCSRSSTSSET